MALNAGSLTHGQQASIVARARDAAGNAGDSAAVAATMDLRADAAFVDPSPADGALTNAAAITYALTREGGAVCLLDGVPVESPCDGEFSVAPATDGAHTVTIRVSDDVGNTTDWSRALRVDRAPPAIVFGDLSAPLPACRRRRCRSRSPTRTRLY